MNYKVYCDESCHLQYDDSKVMVLGSVYCLEEDKTRIFQEIRNIKIKHGLSSYFEIKWTKVSESKIDFYLELLRYFWNEPSLNYRGIVASGKDKLDHKKFNNGDYDLWYYKMYFLMLDTIIMPNNEYQILIDIKDTRGGKRVEKLQEVLCNNIYDFKHDVVKWICQINSNESEIMQIADLLNGAIAYFHRQKYRSDYANGGKVRFVEELESMVNLNKNSARSEQKFNLFIWQPIK